MGVSPADLVQAVVSDFMPQCPFPHTRPVHSFGVGAKGTFEPSAVAVDWCDAPHFRTGPPIEVTVRFSNGRGAPEPDNTRDARGMAVRFHLEGNDPDHTDLIAMTLPVFFTRDVEEFVAFTAAAVPAVHRDESLLERVVDMLSLRQSRAAHHGQPSGDLGTLEYANRHRFARPGVAAAATVVTPKSYVEAAYHAVHTFRVVGRNGRSHRVKFHWQPAAGVHPLDPKAVVRDDYLRTELLDRLDHGSARFVLQAQIGEPGDAFDDPTVQWPGTRRKVVMGSLVLTEALASDDGVDEVELMGFNPGNLVENLEAGDDPILAARKAAYEWSHAQRLAAARRS